MPFLRAFLLLLLALPCLLNAQEIRYIDLTAVRQRTELRHPPAPQSDCKEGTGCIGSGYGGDSMRDGAPKPRDSRALWNYFYRVFPTGTNTTQPVPAKF